jgi:uncharacterized protein YaaQ
MKMIVAIAEENLHTEISNSLINKGFRVTQLSTTSGFLRGGSTTLMIGVGNEKVEEALQLIRDAVPKSPDDETNRVTLYVLNVKSFHQL